jgi:serine/threonine-protein kinase
VRASAARRPEGTRVKGAQTMGSEFLTHWAAWAALGIGAVASIAAVLARRGRARNRRATDEVRERPDTPPGGRRTLGRYDVVGVIGRGAMSSVLLGRDPASGRAVALKTLALGDKFDGEALAEARRRFLLEAGTAARLQYQGIAAVFEAGEDQGLAYIAMEHVKGHDLQRCTQPLGRLSAALVLRIGAQVAEALDYAHRQGVIHRDVKPANVMFDPATGTVKVTDFGIARVTDVGGTRTGLLLGTPAYMAPEQLAGQPADARSDLYSLGVVLFQMLCGRLPHEAESMAALMGQIVHQRAPDIRSVCPQLPEELALCVAALLDKRPDARPADGQRLALDLRAIAALLD